METHTSTTHDAWNQANLDGALAPAAFSNPHAAARTLQRWAADARVRPALTALLPHLLNVLAEAAVPGTDRRQSSAALAAEAAQAKAQLEAAKSENVRSRKLIAAAKAEAEKARVADEVIDRLDHAAGAGPTDQAHPTAHDRTGTVDTGRYEVGSDAKRAGTDYPGTLATNNATGAGPTGREVAEGVGTREAGMCTDRVCVIQRPS